MKETHYKLKHRVTALFAAAVMLCSMLPGAAFAEEPTPQPTEETVQMEQQTEPSETDNGQADESSPDPGEGVTEATPETAEEQPSEEEISAAVVGAELYTDLPDAPIGSYIGSEGLPVATGSTKIGISEWPESQLEETSGSYLTAAALDNDGLTMAAPLLYGADYAIVPIMAQVEYPADGSITDMILPDGVTLLDFYGEPATDADALLHNSYHETSAAVMGVYVQAAADFTAQLVYTGPDGSTQTKTLYVTIDREHTVAYLSKILGKETERTKSQSIGKGSRGSSSDNLQTAGRELCMPDEIRRMRDDECLLLMRSEDPVIDKKYNLLHHPNVKYTPDAGGEPYVMPPDYMGNAVTITMDAVAAATAPEITEEMYEQLDYLEKHPEENYYENEENFSQYEQGD